MTIFEQRKFHINSFKFKKFVHLIYKKKRTRPKSETLKRMEERINGKLRKYAKIYKIFFKEILKIFDKNYIKKFKEQTEYGEMKKRLDTVRRGKKLSYFVAGEILLKNYFLSLRYKYLGIFETQRNFLKRFEKLRVLIAEGDSSLSSRAMELIEEFQSMCHENYRMATEEFNFINKNVISTIQNINLDGFKDMNGFKILGESDEFRIVVCSPINEIFQKIALEFSPLLEHLISVLNVHTQYCNLKYYMNKPFDEFKTFYNVIYEEIERVEYVTNY